jgi:hypothetical protein
MKGMHPEERGSGNWTTGNTGKSPRKSGFWGTAVIVLTRCKDALHIIWITTSQAYLW